MVKFVTEVVNYSSIKAVAVALLVLALTCTQRAHAGEDVHGDEFTSGVSFERYALGDLNPRLTDEGTEDGFFHWYAVHTNDIGAVTLYDSGEAYDYAAHGQARRALFTAQESSQLRYLKVNSEQGLHRSIFSRTSPLDVNFSNVLIRTENRDSIYCDLLVRFSAGAASPEGDATTRFAVWARTLETDQGEIVTNLMATAGYSVDGFHTVVSRDYRLDFDIDLARWYRLVVRAHGDVSSQGVGLAGFTVYIDGEPVRGVAGEYELYDATKVRASLFGAEARALLADRRLFLGLCAPGSDNAYTLSGYEFDGNGHIDDVAFSSEDPGYAQPEKVFTLVWDAGITLLKYTLDGGVTTNAVDVTAGRSYDINIGADPADDLTLTVTDVAYDTAHAYKAGVWSGSNGATLVDGTNFVYDGSSPNPTATIASTRDFVGVGGPDGLGSFAAAFAELDRSPSPDKTLVLLADFTPDFLVDAYGNTDWGYVFASNPEGEYTLDLNGHTLRGASKAREATLLIKCKSFRIIDSSVDKSGRILPIGVYTDAAPRLNTAVAVYPNNAVEPLVTLEAGTYDGWVRNEGQVHQGAARTGVVFVEGGSFISTNSETFYLQQSVTNETMFFSYRNGYWACLSTDVFVWTALGDGTSWSDPENWKCHKVPTATDTALFPSRASEEGPWPVNIGLNGMTTKTLWLEGDIALQGTNDFIGVTLTGGGAGRVAGTATLVFDGDQPGSLTETILSPKWAGTVLLKHIGVSVPKVLRNPEYWGTRYSTVEFNGVRGYVMDVATHTMEYKVRLTDDGATPAWQNDSGYTGSTLAFKNMLLGDGTFKSGQNARAILQLYKFADVSEFTGRFEVNGKRVLLGSDTVSTSTAGLIAFANQAVVRSGLGWTCQEAIFGEALNIVGETNDIIVTATKVEPDVSCCTNTTLNGLANIAWVATTNVPRWAVYVTGERPATLAASDPSVPVSLAAPAVFASSSLNALAASDGYSAAALKPAARLLATAAVQVADASIVIDGDAVCVVVDNASTGLWYGLRYRTSLAAEWTYPAPSEWVRATGPTVSMTCDKTADAGFYGVVVSYEDPRGAGSGD